MRRRLRTLLVALLLGVTCLHAPACPGPAGDPCDADRPCPTDEVCIALNGGPPFCAAACGRNQSCPAGQQCRACLSSGECPACRVCVTACLDEGVN